jgi:hypothetical protein
MTIYENTFFEGERPLFTEKNAKLINVVFNPGESALKHTENLRFDNCEFMCKYPIWHSKNIHLKNSLFTKDARAALWYTEDLYIENCQIDAPKIFRECDGITLRQTKISAATECLWSCRNVSLENVEINEADYLFMNSSNIEIGNLQIEGGYTFQGTKNVIIRNSVINSKDAFWHAENVSVYDSTINGLYLGWHSKNLTLINCTITGEQPLCYATDLTLKNCTMHETDLCFEYSTVNAEITGNIVSVKNPLGGHIKADSIGEIIIDQYCKNPGECRIEVSSDKQLVGCK